MARLTRLILGLTLGTATLAFAADLPRPAAEAWPTLHGDLQRSGFYRQFPQGPLRLVWRKELWRELTGPRAEVMVGGGLAFMGKTRTQSLVATGDSFNFHQQNSDKGEARKLNGDLAGLIGLAHLARWNGDPAVEQPARQRGRQLLELRVNLERTNPFILEKSGAASKNLHNARLARYCKLVPEVGEALAKESAGVGGLNLRAFRLERNGWWLAFGDRLIGGENYTNPAHFPRSLFTGAAFLEQLPAEQLLTFIDVPWCQGDCYFMATCAEALWISAGRPWTHR